MQIGSEIVMGEWIWMDYAFSDEGLRLKRRESVWPLFRRSGSPISWGRQFRSNGSRLLRWCQLGSHSRNAGDSDVGEKASWETHPKAEAKVLRKPNSSNDFILFTLTILDYNAIGSRTCYVSHAWNASSTPIPSTRIPFPFPCILSMWLHFGHRFWHDSIPPFRFQGSSKECGKLDFTSSFLVSLGSSLFCISLVLSGGFLIDSFQKGTRQIGFRQNAWVGICSRIFTQNPGSNCFLIHICVW